jgi:4a-hydroxytetrahydrobiopterin dehydratase
MKSLTNKSIVLPREGDSPLDEKKREEYLELLPDWGVVDREGIPRLERGFKFPDYQSGLGFTNQVGALADEVDHHPAILLTWGRVVVSWWTHIFKDLSEADFILAAKTEELYQKLNKMEDREG